MATGDPTAARSTLAAGLVLAAIAAVVVLVLALVDRATEEQIARNERAWFLAQLNEFVPPGSYDNDWLEDRAFLVAPATFGTLEAVPVYRARKDGRPVAAVFRTIAPDGYGGPIALMIAIRSDGTLAGVSVLEHRETPGLGDLFEPRRSNWLETFVGRSLGDPPADDWAVRKDGGAFDQFTGATITPRAIVNAVRRTLEYFERERAAIFEAGRS
ncbi:MAG TPA: electron transport complex subunit RsxG [Steroidobacteraceae bacterium]|nr:electron transport complex subunit RsxG [Steroidobacteraceae bacterium]